MSIDATILEVERDGADVVLTLGNRIDDKDAQSIAGQPKLRILNATWEPEPGMDIWGGGSSVQIITKRGERDPATNNAIGPWYRREGYTRLQEKQEPYDRTCPVQPLCVEDKRVTAMTPDPKPTPLVSLGLAFTAVGKPEPQGSSKGFVLPAKGERKARAVVTSDNPRNKDWRRTVAFAALAARPRGFAPLAGPVLLQVAFHLPRPQRLKAGGGPHVTRPDLDKLVRSVCDALTGIAWADDGQVAKVVATKRHADDAGPRAEVRVGPYEEELL